MERKDMLLENSSKEDKISPEEEKKLRKAAEDGGGYLTMINGAGWKLLIDNFISKRISQERYLMAPGSDLADIRAAQKELYELLHFVKHAIDEGQKAYTKLHNSK